MKNTIELTKYEYKIVLESIGLDIILGFLETTRLDSILGETKYDQDEIGLIMAKLGDKEMIDIHLK